MTLVQPLNFEQIFVQYLAGSWVIFLFLAIIAFAYISARFKLPNVVFMFMLLLFGVMMMPFYPAYMVFIVIIVGVFISIAMYKMLS